MSAEHLSASSYDVGEIEQCLLGALLVRDDVYDEVSWMREAYFFNAVHGRIFECIRKLREAGQAATPQIVAQFFTEDADIAHLGGATYILDLARSVVSTSPVTVRSYGNNVYAAHLRRAVSHLGGTLQDLARTASADEHPKEFLARAEKFISEASDAQSGDSVRHIGDNVSDVIAEAKNPTRGIATGIPKLDQITRGLKKGWLYVVAGRPGMGKTALLCTLGANVAIGGAKTLIFSLEMPQEQLTERLLSRFSKQSVHSQDVEDWAQVDSAVEKVTRLPLHVDDTPGLTISDIAARARRHKRVKGLDVIFIDYLGLIESRDRGAQMVHQIAEVTKGLKNLAKSMGVPIVLLSQLNRAVEQREDKRPMMSDLRDSGSIEQDADVIVFVYRKEYYLERERPESASDGYGGKAKAAEKLADYEAQLSKWRGKAELIVAKQRQGKSGSVFLNFDARGQVFYE